MLAESKGWSTSWVARRTVKLCERVCESRRLGVYPNPVTAGDRADHQSQSDGSDERHGKEEHGGYQNTRNFPDWRTTCEFALSSGPASTDLRHLGNQYKQSSIKSSPTPCHHFSAFLVYQPNDSAATWNPKSGPLIGSSKRSLEQLSARKGGVSSWKGFNGRSKFRSNSESFVLVLDSVYL